jgi:putative CRISPR-associated protein (TIGR02620 family)
MRHDPDADRPFLLVSRHEGARQWLLAEAVARGWHPVQLVAHLDDPDWRGARGVAGTLPLSLVSRLCDAGIPVWLIDLPLTAETRGMELSQCAMVAHGAQLRQVMVRTVEEIS